MLKKLIVLACSALILSGCSYTVMSPTKYKKYVGVQSNQSAWLYWDQGQVLAKELSTNSVGSNIAIELSPNAYKLQYGPARQVIFVTSLRDQLRKHGVFKDVTIETAPKKLKPGHVIVDIWFKKTQVKAGDGAYPATLDVVLYIKGYGQPLFKREYTIKSKSGIWTAMTYSFKDQTEYMSQELMNKVISGIIQWYQQEDKAHHTAS